MNEITWNIDNPNDMRIVLRQYGNIIMQISVYEVIESCSRIKIMQHVAECDRTPWLTRWQNEKHAGIVDLLTKDYSDV
jgi:hypothetical protein